MPVVHIQFPAGSRRRLQCDLRCGKLSNVEEDAKERSALGSFLNSLAWIFGETRSATERLSRAKATTLQQARANRDPPVEAVQILESPSTSRPHDISSDLKPRNRAQWSTSQKSRAIPARTEQQHIHISEVWAYGKMVQLRPPPMASLVRSAPEK